MKKEKKSKKSKKINSDIEIYLEEEPKEEVYKIYGYYNNDYDD